MTQVWSEDDRLIPVTVIQAGPCAVTQIKTVDKEGYEAIQIGFDTIKKQKKVNKPTKGHFEKSGVAPTKVLREVHVASGTDYELGQQITVDFLADVKKVDVTGISKGKGFAGVMKRHNYGGGPGGHGAHFHRAPGSIGQCATPSRVFKGNDGPGRMGRDTVTVQNLELIKVVPERNALLVKGAIPGGRGSLVRVSYAVKGE
jgi:large subunit ribosomal protein L3